MTNRQSSILLRASAGTKFSGRPAKKHQSGIGMIDVMMAVLVLSVAFLGMAALQASALSTNNSAMARSMATIAVHSIQDAMRADLANATGGVYNTTVTANNCPAAGSSLASAQLNQWCNELASTLGASTDTTGKIQCQTNGNCAITVTFDDSHAGAGSSNQVAPTVMQTQGML